MMQGVHASKGSMGNGVPSGDAAARVAADDDEEQRPVEEEEEEGEGKSVLVPRGLVRRPWNHHSTAAASRIYRVSRASGGKDRHSKVMTAKGLRDRRVRLSVSTAIQFYDLQDRLGVDQPSKAVEWLIKAAADAITDLPSLDGVFPADDDLAAAAVPPPGATHHEEQHKPPHPHPPDDEEDIADVSHQQLHYTNHLGRLQQHQQEQQHHLSLTRSTCSSTSETSKGSVLSLSRSEGRVKARERARERAATAKVDKDMEDDAHIPSATHRQAGVNPLPTTTTQTSFTQLLACGGHHNHAHHTSVAAHANPAPADFVHKQLRHQLPTSTTADYFGQLLGTGQKPHQPTGMFSSQAHFGGSTSPTGMVQQQHYMQEHLIPFAVTSAAAGGDYINFSISSGFNRGTLQSNSPSPSLHHHLQMFSSPVDGSNLPFFLGTAAQAASASGEAQLPAGFDSRLQLCYGGYRHSDLKGKGKN